MNDVSARDSQPILPRPDDVTRRWLERLANAANNGALVLRLGEDARDDDQPLVYCERDGTWWCGRYVGTVTFEGRRLVIEPRFGIDTLAQWLELALDVRLSESAGTMTPHEAFLPQLLARLWGHAIVRAARHGPPALRVDVNHHGVVVRGRLDVRATVSARARGSPGVSSIQRVRSLENPIVAAIAAAHEALRRRLGLVALQRLIPERARDLLSAIGATGMRSAGPPEDEDIARIRFTPITAGYRSLVRLSLGIARNRGLLSDTSPDGQTTGVLLDVAELWELFVLEALRRARPRSRVLHGSRDARANGYLLTGKARAFLGRLMPDALILEGGSSIVADAKYKSAHPRASRPTGVEREDLYQMRAYVSRWSGASAGMLIYPSEGAEPPVVTDGPWRFDDGRELHFVSLPIAASDATPLLERLLASLLDEHPNPRDTSVAAVRA